MAIAMIVKVRASSLADRVGDETQVTPFDGRPSCEQDNRERVRVLPKNRHDVCRFARVWVGLFQNTVKLNSNMEACTFAYLVYSGLFCVVMTSFGHDVG